MEDILKNKLKYLVNKKKTLLEICETLEDDTPFSRSMGFKNEKSCYWVDIEVDNKGNIYSIEPTLEVFEGNKLIRRR